MKPGSADLSKRLYIFRAYRELLWDCRMYEQQGVLRRLCNNDEIYGRAVRQEYRHQDLQLSLIISQLNAVKF